MYLCIDVGGTKTLVASVDDNGVITDQIRFETPQNYEDFLVKLADSVKELNVSDYVALGIGIPATDLDRDRGIGVNFAHLTWKKVPIRANLEDLFKLPVALENDAKLAGLSESMLRKNKKRLLYVTVSTGIGYSLIVNNKIDPNIGDGGGSLLVLEYKGQYLPWEDFAAGSAIVKIFGRKAEDIFDKPTWKSISKNLSLGLIELVAVTEPDVIVLGGSVGAFLERYLDQLKEAMAAYETPLFKIPNIEQAIRPNEAVIFGAFDLASSIHNSKLK